MSRASPPDVPHVLQYWLGSPRMTGLGAPIGPKFRDGAIWGAKPSPFGATRWTRGDVYPCPYPCPCAFVSVSMSMRCPLFVIEDGKCGETGVMLM